MIIQLLLNNNKTKWTQLIVLCWLQGEPTEKTLLIISKGTPEAGTSPIAITGLLVISGWIIVTATFILCGILLLLHNVTGDTCVAMNHWVQNPTVHTALDDILPCVDKTTAEDTLNRSKEVTSQLVNVINTVISNVSNINFAPNFVPLYFNQSGPLVPALCNPFNPDLTDRECAPGEVDLNNATEVWSGYVCQTSASGICVTTGRLNPTLYDQMAATINVSYGLYRYGPFLVELEDCSFVRQTLLEIEATYCPGLGKYSQRVYVGLVMVGTAVMLSLVFWVIYGERGGTVSVQKTIHQQAKKAISMLNE
ncbi:UNVERIFIED_CONTAM: hypothetical protein Sradi_1696500 [Sesamum radiatum]|uniref:Uncharacterized protein n=1 Tax=Sesamum radiatum TaxID=300843 RepID=A0AAW2TVJ6_SESRA